MTSIATTLLISCLMMMFVGFVPEIHGADNSQYRAVVTKIFLSKYHAIPAADLNPVFPGDVITLKNKTKYLDHSVCYPNIRVGKYTAIEDYAEGTDLSLSGDLKVGGELIHKKIAEIEAQGNVKFARTGVITISPLSKEEVTTVRLKAPNERNSECRIIGDLLSGKTQGYAVTQRVYHGRTRISVNTHFRAGVGATAKGELLKKLANVFKINEPEINCRGMRLLSPFQNHPATCLWPSFPQVTASRKCLE